MALVLTREVNEDIILRMPDGRDIVIKVVEIRQGYKVRLGIDAPGDVAIWRRELLERMMTEGVAGEDPLIRNDNPGS